MVMRKRGQAVSGPPPGRQIVRQWNKPGTKEKEVMSSSTSSSSLSSQNSRRMNFGGGSSRNTPPRAYSLNRGTIGEGVEAAEVAQRLVAATAPPKLTKTQLKETQKRKEKWKHRIKLMRLYLNR
jgi:hypothetical protein